MNQPTSPSPDTNTLRIDNEDVYFRQCFAALIALENFKHSRDRELFDRRRRILSVQRDIHLRGVKRSIGFFDECDVLSIAPELDHLIKDPTQGL